MTTNQDITPNIISVGVDDTDADIFERQYHLHNRGMSYNSYAIIDTEIAIMDSVEAGRSDEWMANILRATGGRAPSYLVVQHMEPDHSAGIMDAATRWPEMKIVASANALKMLRQFFPSAPVDESRTIAVAEGSTLPLGNHTLHFYAAPMIHWPEVIVTYESATATLFSADAFGKFGALALTAGQPWQHEARRYFINIVGKYGRQVQALLKKAASLPAIKTIAPLHGPILRGDEIKEAIRLYDLWSRYTHEEPGVLIASASIYGGTAQAAHYLTERLRDMGVKNVVELDLTEDDRAEAVAQAFRFSHLVVAAPTYDASIFPPMHDFLHHLSLKNYSNRTVAIIENGSWAPMAGRLMQKMLESMPGMTILEPMVTIRSRPDADTFSRLDEMAGRLARSIAGTDNPE